MPKVYECQTCSFSSPMKQNYEKHLTSKKHMDLQSQTTTGADGGYPRDDNVNLTIKEIKTDHNNNEIELLKLLFETKLKEIEYKFELKISNLENKLLEYKLLAVTQQRELTGDTPIQQRAMTADNPVERQKILPITFIKTQMKNALTIKKTQNDRYENGRDPHGLKDIITLDDLDIIMKSNYMVGIKPIFNKILKHYGGKTNFKIVCVDKNRKRFFIHLEQNDKIDWIEDEYNTEIIFFLKCINYTLEALYVEWSNKYNRGDVDLLVRISGAIDETHENYCLNKLIYMSAEMLCICNVVEDYNNGLSTTNNRTENIIEMSNEQYQSEEE